MAPNPTDGPKVTQKSSIFVDGNEPIKFFLQQDTGQTFLAWLSHKIEEHGGIVVSTVPIKGYVLIDPDTEKGSRLVERWQVPDKPNRHVVCYTFVRACIIAGQRIPPSTMKDIHPFFKHHNMPVEIFLHPSLEGTASQDIAIEIEKAGGVTETTEERARVIIAPRKSKPEAVLFKDLTFRYEHNPDKFVEDLDWVRNCLAQKKYENSPPMRRNMGGRKPGSARTEYTAEDDENLVKYIGRRIPNAALGGRLGNNLYIELTDRATEYPWAQRHTWHSWRNRYKTRQLIFDVAIDRWLQANPQPEGQKGQMLFVRLPAESMKDEPEGAANDENAAPSMPMKPKGLPLKVNDKTSETTENLSLEPPPAKRLRTEEGIREER